MTTCAPPWCAGHIYLAEPGRWVWADDDLAFVRFAGARPLFNMVRRLSGATAQRHTLLPVLIGLQETAKRHDALAYFGQLLRLPDFKGEIQVPASTPSLAAIFGAPLPLDWYCVALRYRHGELEWFGVFFTEDEYQCGQRFGRDDDLWMFFQLYKNSEERMAAIHDSLRHSRMTLATIAVVTKLDLVGTIDKHGAHMTLAEKSQKCLYELRRDPRTCGDRWREQESVAVTSTVLVLCFTGAWRSRTAARLIVEDIFGNLGTCCYWSVDSELSKHWTPPTPNHSIGWQHYDKKVPHSCRIPVFTPLPGVQRTWYGVHPQLLGISLAFAPLQVPPYVLLEIVDWLPLYAQIEHVLKIKLLGAARRTYNAIYAARESKQASRVRISAPIEWRDPVQCK